MYWEKEDREMFREMVHMGSKTLNTTKILKMSYTMVLWLEKCGGWVNEILAQVHLMVGLIVISPLTEFIIQIHKLKRWKSLTLVP